jgi:hypothetical protein
VCACFSGRADFHIPAARLLVGNYYQDAERENIVAFVRCSSAIKKERPFSCFLSFSFPLVLFSFSLLRILYYKSACRLYSPRSVMLIFCVHCRLRCAVVALARRSFFIEMFYLCLLCRIIYYTAPKLRNKEFTCSAWSRFRQPTMMPFFKRGNSSNLSNNHLIVSICAAFEDDAVPSTFCKPH